MDACTPITSVITISRIITMFNALDGTSACRCFISDIDNLDYSYEELIFVGTCSSDNKVS